MNIFRVLSSYDGCIDEPNISSFLAYLLDPYEDHGLSFLLLQEVLKEFLTDESALKEIRVNNRIKDLSNLSDFAIEITPELPVCFLENEKQVRRDIDILVEIFSKGKSYSFCIENKINDSSINLKEDQLNEQIKGLQQDRYKDSNPEIYLILITLKPSDKSSKFFEQVNHPKKLHLYWNHDQDSNSLFSKILNILDKEIKCEIDPINNDSKFLIRSFLSFIKTEFKNYFQEKQELKERANYGQTVIEYLNKFTASLNVSSEFKLEFIKDGLSKFVKQESGKDLNPGTRNAHVTLSIVNERNRAHYNIKDPKDERKNLFYYPDINNKKILKRFDSKINKDVNIYFKNPESGQIDSKKTYEVYKN